MSDGKPEMDAGENLGALLPHIRQLLKPLAALVVGRVPYTTLSEVLKEVLIEAAEEKMRLEEPAKRITKSAIALKTGIDSRSISRQCDTTSIRELSHPFADLLAMWKWDPEWRDEAGGQPLLLRIYGSGKTFQTLVNRSIGKNISYSEVMEVLLKAGNIARADDNALKLVQPFYKFGTSELEADRLRFFGNLSQMLAYCIRNRMACPQFEPTPNAVFKLMRSVPRDRIEALAVEMGEMLMRHANEAGDVLETYDEPDTAEPVMNAGIGLFFWTRPAED